MMFALVLILGAALAQQQAAKPPEPRLDVRAERGIGGVQTDGWQHIALRIDNHSGQPISGRATLYEYESQVGARPRVVLPFAVTDRQVLHFYPFRPPETPQPSNYVITLADDSGRPIEFDGASQFVIAGRSVRALRVETGGSPNGDFRVGLWGETNPLMRTLVNEWSPSLDDIYRITGGRLNARQFIGPGGQRISPEAVPLEQPRLLPDSFVGYGDLAVLMILGVDPDQSLTERQRRALSDWVHAGGMLVVVPRRRDTLTGPFMRELVGIKDRGEVTTQDDQHLPLSPDAGPHQQIVHFLTEVDPSRPVEAIASYDGVPVVYSAPAGFGRVWVVGFDPEAHGGTRRYRPLWQAILNQTLKYRVTDGPAPTSLAAQPWSYDGDNRWLSSLGQRFGKAPALDKLAILILGYLLVVGPANFFVLKRREARVWLIGTVPGLAVIFGGAVLAMGYVSHGLRAATNQMGLAVVTPEGDRAYAHDYVAVYGTTSAEYRLGFPRNLPVRPVGEFVSSPNGGFENLSSFKLAAREDRIWLEDWRLTFWQTRGTASVDCLPLRGQLTAVRRGSDLVVSNQTLIEFDSVVLVAGVPRPLGPLKPFESKTIELPAEPRAELLDGTTDAALRPQQQRASGEAEAWASGLSEANWLEADFLIRTADSRLNQQNRHWIFGITRQPIHPVETPDTRKHLVASLYAWPVVMHPKTAKQDR